MSNIVASTVPNIDFAKKVNKETCVLRGIGHLMEKSRTIHTELMENIYSLVGDMAKLKLNQNDARLLC